MNTHPEIQRLREGKALLRRQRIDAPLADKVQSLLRLQRLYVDIVGSQRPLLAWQRPWNITCDVTDWLVITDNSVFFPNRPFSASQSSVQWIRPAERIDIRA